VARFYYITSDFLVEKSVEPHEKVSPIELFSYRGFVVRAESSESAVQIAREIAAMRDSESGDEE
jgi:hypothetical protein